MSSSRRSEFSLLALAVLCGGVFLSACQDDLPPPTSGTLLIEVEEGSAGAAAGAVVTIGDEMIALEPGTRNLSRILPAGTYTVRIDKDCTTASPGAEQTVEVRATGVHTVSWQLEVNGGLLVESTIPGAPIFLDGVDTGRVTPTTFECQEAGTVVVSLGAMPGFAPPDPITVEVAEVLASAVFDFGEPLDQSRGTVVELLTAVDCAFCLPADEAAELLWDRDPSRADAGIISLQIHHPWSIPDVFRTPETEARNTFYGFPPTNGSHPITRTNGGSQTIGFPTGQTVETFYEAMLGRIEPFITGDRSETIVALYWLDSEFDEATHIVTAVARVVALDTIPNPALTSVLGMIYKNDLTTFARVHGRNVEFYRVVRDIVEIGTCAELGIEERGDWADVRFVYDLASDTQWSEEEMGVVALVQETGEGGSKEIFNVRHRYVN